MPQREARNEIVRKLLKTTNRAVFVCGILSLPLGFILGSATTVYILSIVICAVVVAVQSRIQDLHIGLYALSMWAGLVVVCTIALIGFYGPRTTAVNEFGAGMGTFVADKSMYTAIKDSLTEADTFTAAALFKLNCSGPDCSNTAWGGGVLTVYAILTGGVVAGNLLVKKQLIPPDTQAKDAK